MVCIMLVLLRRRLLIFWPWNLGHCVCVREESEQYLRGVFYSHIMGDVTEHTKIIIVVVCSHYVKFEPKIRLDSLFEAKLNKVFLHFLPNFRHI